MAEAALKADVLLTDVALRGPSGPEVAAELRRRAPRLRVIYMTGHDPEAARALKPSGRLLPKPFKPEQLLEAVRAELEDAARLGYGNSPAYGACVGRWSASREGTES